MQRPPLPKTPPTRFVNSRACMASTETVRAAVNALKDAGCQVTDSVKAGHVRVFDGAARVYTALQKYPGGPWIVMTSESDRIKWVAPATAEKTDGV